jgi:hypothetical protein
MYAAMKALDPPAAWANGSGLPTWVSAVVGALHLRQPDMDSLARLSDAEWQAALDFCDRSRLTLALGNCARGQMPPWVRERADRNFAHNRARLGRLRALYQELSAALQPIEFVALKGITHTALSGGRLEDRVQYDVDLYAPWAGALAAREILLSRGYESLAALEEFPTDHLPALIRKTGWEWRGDFFDPEIPTAIELHFRFWDEQTERLAARGVEAFWERRRVQEIGGLRLPVLHPVDALGYTALHVSRHLLRGSVDAFSVLELAWMLERNAGDDRLWKEWRALHSRELRRLEAVAFQLARAWFGCEAAGDAVEAIAELPAGAARWFDTFAASPLCSSWRAHKDELWLHCSLLNSAADRWRVAQRRLFPMRLPGPVDAVYLPEENLSFRRRWIRRWRYAAHLARRFKCHAAALPRTAAGALWWLRTHNAVSR